MNDAQGGGGGGLVRLAVTPIRPCSYLPERRRRLVIHAGSDPDPAALDHWLSLGYRRSGPVFYAPDCPGGCRECVPIRIPVAAFLPSRSQRRVARRNAESITIEVGAPRFRREALDLYNRHARWVDPDVDPATEEDYRRFLLDTSVPTWMFEYRSGGELAGVGLLDHGKTAASSVYFFWEPELAERSLGTYSALCELAWCRGRGLHYYYLGYWVHGCRSMSYKNRFRPYELMDWQTCEWRVGPDGRDDAGPCGTNGA